MPTSLEDALREVELEAGRTYEVRVRGFEIEVRVRPVSVSVDDDGGDVISDRANLLRPGAGVPVINRPGPLPVFRPPEALDQAMIEAPYDLPHSKNGFRCEVRAVAELPRLNMPEIPADEVAE